MTNPFSGIITDAHKSLYKNMIMGLLEGVSTTCRLVYGDTIFTDCPNCWTAGTMIQTPYGPKPIEKIKIGEKVFDGTTYQLVTNTLSQIYTGYFYNIKAGGIRLPSEMTPNHILFVERSFGRRKKYKKYQQQLLNGDFDLQEVSAENLSCGDAIFIPIPKHRTKSFKFSQSEFGPIPLNDDILWFIGWWLAEGFLHKSKYIREGTFALSQDEEHIAYSLKRILKKYFGLKGHLKYKKDSYVLTVTFYSTKLASWLKQFGHLCYNKKIPPYLYKKLSINQKYKILTAFQLGDGHIRCRGNIHEYSLATTSRILAFQMYEILLGVGQISSISYKDSYVGNDNIHRASSWTVTWHPENLFNQKNIRPCKGGFLSKITDINKVYKSDMIYDITVKNTHLYIANNILSHNCIFDNITNKSSNRYQAGGPIPFPNGTICPYCNSHGRFGTESTEDIELGVIWDYKMFVSLGDNEPILNLKNPTGMIQTVSRVDTTVDKLRRAKKLIAATEKETVMRQTFEKASEPDFGGLGEHHFMIMLWKRLK